jgi:hypothetical protein
VQDDDDCAKVDQQEEGRCRIYLVDEVPVWFERYGRKDRVCDGTEEMEMQVVADGVDPEILKRADKVDISASLG